MGESFPKYKLIANLYMFHIVETSGYSGPSCPQFAQIEENNNMVTYYYNMVQPRSPPSPMVFVV
jgi:hypothetical protein